MDWRQLAVPVVTRDDAQAAAPPLQTWPDLGWYLMLPPKTDGAAFRDDVLPLEAFATAPDRRLVRRHQDYPNWNCRVVSWEAEQGP